MVGGQRRRDDCDTELTAKGEHPNATIDALLEATERVCPEEANTQKKNSCNGRPH
jgi:hypothetical protein